MTAAVSAGPLEGIRVLDVSIMAAGPWTAALLGMLGAEVIKVEPPAGDGTRWATPTQHGMGTNFIAMNVNKKDIELDLKSDHGRQAARDLAATCDIFVQNFRVGAVERLGLGYDDISAINPRLIYCSISGFGSHGPLATAGCGDPIMQAFSGFASLNGSPSDVAESFRFTGFLDLSTASIAAEAILAALARRNETGRGQEIELSMLDAALEMQFSRVSELLGAGVVPKPRGSETPAFAPDRAFLSKDKYVFVSARSETEWRAFCAAMNLETIVDDPRFNSNRRRCENRSDLHAILEPLFAAKSAVWWLRVLGRHHVPCVIAHDFESFRYHSQIVENEMIATVTTDTWGSVYVGGLPWHFSKTPCEVRPPSQPGADTEEVLAALPRHAPGPKAKVTA